MARPVKTGLDYFPKDTDFYRDRKIRALIGRFGADGAALYDYILCEVYGDKGYFAIADDSFVDIAAADLCMSPEKIGLILNYLLDKSMLLDGTLFKAVKAISSHGIQTRYQEAVRQRAAKKGICVDGELWLLNEAETEGFIQVRHSENYSEKNHSKSEKNHGFSTKEFTKESKVKESKEKEIKEEERSSAIAAVMSAYQNKVNPLMSERSRDELIGFVQVMGPDVCLRAIDTALDAKKASWPYIKAILQSKQAQGVRCLADWDALEEKRRKPPPPKQFDSDDWKEWCV